MALSEDVWERRLELGGGKKKNLITLALMFNLNLPPQHLRNLRRKDPHEGEAEGLWWREAAQSGEESSAGFKSWTDLMKATNY